jgi:serralysin
VSPSIVNVYDADSGALLRSFDIYPGFTGGVSVAVGDLNADGTAEVITGAGAAARTSKCSTG